MKELTAPERFALEKFGGVPRQLIDCIGRSQMELFFAHDLLALLVEPVVHERLHAAALEKFKAARAKAPEMADTAEKGECLYNMLCFKFIQRRGRDEYELIKKKNYPELV